MNRFASGPKRNYYGKADVTAYRLDRGENTSARRSPVFGANVTMLLYGDAFWQTYATGDNSGLIATDSMKNFIQRETENFTGSDLEAYCHFLAHKFLLKYPQTEGVQLSAVEIPYQPVAGGSTAYSPAGAERAMAQVELAQAAQGTNLIEGRSGIRGFKLLRLNGSAFTGFVRDEYTTLPEITNRPLHMWLDLDWTYSDAVAFFSDGRVLSHVRKLVFDIFNTFESGSIQQVIYQMGTRILEEIPTIAEVNLEADNRTWDTVLERGAMLGVYTDPRPPYGCLGLTLHR